MEEHGDKHKTVRCRQTGTNRQTVNIQEDDWANGDRSLEGRGKRDLAQTTPLKTTVNCVPRR